ncbi:MAG: UrcA family protein [Steroidobacteraceae bacterium]
MYTQTAAISSRALLGFAVAACAFLVSNARAETHEVTVAVHVSTQGLDLNQDAGARGLYLRLRRAALVACGDADRVGLQASADPVACYETALGNAVRSVRLRLLTQIYLESHTLRQAAAHGIDVPAQIASK